MAAINFHEPFEFFDTNGGKRSFAAFRPNVRSAGPSCRSVNCHQGPLCVVRGRSNKHHRRTPDTRCVHEQKFRGVEC